MLDYHNDVWNVWVNVFWYYWVHLELSYCYNAVFVLHISQNVLTALHFVNILTVLYIFLCTLHLISTFMLKDSYLYINVIILSRVARSPIFYGSCHISACLLPPGRKPPGRPNLPVFA